ncbi:hypothetical protein EKK58_00710 [Candidatus Dependentiae bacterium]|nr:MAG: hypothetical protein EKK58_00710 [Candidatus Dependentiae bacterium]
MLTFHSIWTRPAVAKGNEEITLWDFEWLTWLAGILYAKQYGDVVLVADERGAEFVKKAGLAECYDEVILGLDEVPKEVDPEIFWAAGKLYAIRLLKRSREFDPFDGPVASLDWDCIPWNYPDEQQDIMCLNLESLQWPWYKDCRSKYEKFVPKAVNWNLPPANNGIFHFNHYKHMLAYSDLSIGFMERFGRAANQQNYFDQPRYVYGDAMTFAEQQLMATAAWHSKRTIEPFLSARADGFLQPNTFFTHLWTTKNLYRAFPEARIHYTNQLIRILRQRFPETHEILEDKGLHVTQPVLTHEENLVWNREGQKHFPSHNVGIVKALEGQAVLRDRNISGSRSLAVGGVVLPGDRVLCGDSNTKIELEFTQTSEYPA